MNIFHVLFILSVSALTESLAGKVTRYDNLIVITSMDVTRPDPDNPKRVEFISKLTKEEMQKYADDEGKHEARLITNVEFFKDENKFRADEVDISVVKASGKKLLFCLHGIDNAPEEHLERCLKNRDNLEKFKVIPVIWPIYKEGWVRYALLKIIDEFQLDKDSAKAAALAFKEYMNKHTGQISAKSVMAHSLGNRVVRYACEGNDSKFDNIFMCAAAVPRSMFSEDGAESKNGLALLKTLKHSHSKIHVLYNKKDRILLTNPAVKIFKHPINIIFGWEHKQRLGAYGVDMEKLHPDLEGKIENINCEKWVTEQHGYQWDTEAIQIYEDTY